MKKWFINVITTLRNLRRSKMFSDLKQNETVFGMENNWMEAHPEEIKIAAKQIADDIDRQILLKIFGKGYR